MSRQSPSDPKDGSGAPPNGIAGLSTTSPALPGITDRELAARTDRAPGLAVRERWGYR